MHLVPHLCNDFTITIMLNCLQNAIAAELSFYILLQSWWKKVEENVDHALCCNFIFIFHLTSCPCCHHINTEVEIVVLAANYLNTQNQYLTCYGHFHCSATLREV